MMMRSRNMAEAREAKQVGLIENAEVTQVREARSLGGGPRLRVAAPRLRGRTGGCQRSEVRRELLAEY